MRRLWDVLTDRYIEQRNDTLYWMKLAMRDIRDFPNEYPDPYRNLEPKPTPIFKPRPVDKEIDELKGLTRYLQNKVKELEAKQKGSEY